MRGKSGKSRLREYLWKLNRSHVNVEKYIKEFYIENDLAYISCNVKSYYDIIDSYSVEGYEWLSERFSRFVETNAEYIPVEYPVVLEICGHKFSDREKTVIEETIRDYYALKMGDAQLDITRNNRTGIFLLVLSVISGILIYMNKVATFNMIASEMVMIMFWMFVWEFVDCILFEGSRLQEEKSWAAQLANIKVVFRDHFSDEPDSETVQEEIFNEALEGPDEEPVYAEDEGEEE